MFEVGTDRVRVPMAFSAFVTLLTPQNAKRFNFRCDYPDAQYYGAPVTWELQCVNSLLRCGTRFRGESIAPGKRNLMCCQMNMGK
jgi:hypothetical protein